MRIMKKIGIIGGFNLDTTLNYYERINRLANDHLGGMSTPDMTLRSVNPADYCRLMKNNDWHHVGQLLATEVFQLLFDDCCDHVAVASCSMHRFATHIERSLGSIGMDENPPFVHIGDCIANECKVMGARSVLLLGKKSTMTEGFISGRLSTHGIETIDTSNFNKEIDEIDRIISEELCRGRATMKSWNFLLDFIHQFSIEDGSRPDAVVLGSTELGLMLRQDDVDIPLIDAMEVHIRQLAKLSSVA